jgi:hypothetical protein
VKCSRNVVAKSRSFLIQSLSCVGEKESARMVHLSFSLSLLLQTERASLSQCVSSVFFFSRSPVQAPYGANWACAKRATFPDPPVVPHPESRVKGSQVQALRHWSPQLKSYDDHPFIVLTETKFSFRCIPVWDRYSPHRTRVEKQALHM